MSPPRANSAAARDIAYALHPYTDLKAHLETGPVVMRRGEGVRVWDDSGREYIDALAGLWCASLGFSNERLVEAAARQMRTLPFYHSFAAKSHEPMIELAEMLVARAPVPMSKVLFANSGSEANDSAIKMVWYFNNALGRPRQEEDHRAAEGLSRHHRRRRLAHRPAGQPPQLRRAAARLRAHDGAAPLPHAEPGESEEAFAARCADELEKLILAEDPETVAAMWAEPVMGAGGVIVPPRGYFEAIQPVLKKYDILLVADEVICGFWRTANYWGTQTLGMQPDIITCAKALSASYLPISGIMVNERVFAALAEESHTIGTFGHGFTYSGHPVAAAVAVETLKIYDETDIGGHVRAVAPHMQAALRKRFAGHELVGEVRGVGLIAAIELVQDKAAHKNFAPELKVGPRAAKLCEANGVISRSTVNDVLAFSPPLIITEAEIDMVVEGVGRAVDELAVQLRREQIAAV